MTPSRAFRPGPPERHPHAAGQAAHQVMGDGIMVLDRAREKAQGKRAL
jgi:hypothetical protein